MSMAVDNWRIGNTNSRKHGATKIEGGRVVRSLTYNSWRCMKERCLDEKHKWYPAYGGRGITIDPRWLGRDGFKNFLSDVGERPAKHYTLDRREVDGHYTKDNCFWATKSEQRNNQRPVGTPNEPVAPARFQTTEEMLSES